MILRCPHPRPYFGLALLLGGLACSHPSSPPEAAPAANAPAPTADADAAAVDDAFRAAAPPSQPTPPLRAPVPRRTLLSNGLTVLTVHKPGLPIVHASLVIRSGSAADPADQEGLAGFTADMLEMGTQSLSAAQLAERVEGYGTSINIEVDEDTTSLSTTALAEHFPGVFAILAEMAQQPAFAVAEVERVRKSRSATLAQSQDSPQYAASAAFRRVVFGSHPYAHLPLGSSRTVAKIQRSQLQSFYKSHYRPANSALILVGDLDDAAALTAAQAAFGAWQGPRAQRPNPPPPRARAAEVSLVARPDAPQSQLVLGHLGVAREDPDYYALVLCNAILGGVFNSRINMNLREAHGYTYGTYSHFDFMRQRGAFWVAGGIRTDATEAAVREILKEIGTLREVAVTDAELQSFKSRYTISLPSAFQTVSRIADMVARIDLFDLPLDYYQHLPELIEAVTPADVLRVAQTHLRPPELNVVVVGDPAQVGPGLTHLGRGPLHRRSATGEPN